jgi:hypothetical protein
MDNSEKPIDNERLEIGYLLHADGKTVFEWLRAHYQEPTKVFRPGNGVDDTGRRLLEYLLIKRNEKLIDYGIARYGYTISSIQKVFDRGNSSTRFAALGNVRGGMRLRQAIDLIRYGKPREIRQILKNQWLSNDTLIALIARDEEYFGVTDRQFYNIISALQHNKRLMTPNVDTWMDGYEESVYNRVFEFAWSLPSIVPSTQEWALLLSNLLRETIRRRAPIRLDNIIERWFIDEPKVWSPSILLRELLYDFKKADETLLESKDPAARRSFYKRFSPYKYSDWENYLNLDGEQFTRAALENENLWRLASERQKLNKICWDTPDRNAEMLMPDLYHIKEQHLRKSVPEWFEEHETKETGCPIEALHERVLNIERVIENLQISDNSAAVEYRLEKIQRSLETIMNKKGFIW